MSTIGYHAVARNEGLTSYPTIEQVLLVCYSDDADEVHAAYESAVESDS